MDCPMNQTSIHWVGLIRIKWVDPCYMQVTWVGLRSPAWGEGW